MTDDEARSIVKKTKAYAIKIGWARDADDFSQYCVMMYLYNPHRKAPLKYLWIDFLRKTIVDKTTRSGKAVTNFVEVRNHHLTTPCYDELINDNYKALEYAKLFAGDFKALYLQIFTQDISQAQLAIDFGVSEAHISNMKKKMIKIIKHRVKYDKCY